MSKQVESGCADAARVAVERLYASVESLEKRMLFATFLVTNDNNAGLGSLRRAINDANNRAGADEIHFNIGDEGGAQVIKIRTQLPQVLDDVTIDATTQPGYDGVPLIEIDGTLANDPAAEEVHGLIISSGHSTVKGLIINSFGGHGLYLHEGNENHIEGNYLGTNADGSAGDGNGFSGLYVYDSSDNLILANVISGNHEDGITITGSGDDGGLLGSASTGNRILGNFVGTDASGTSAIPNKGYGVVLGHEDNLVGGTDDWERNILSGNKYSGLAMGGNGRHTALGNYVGTDITGMSAIPNGVSGIVVTSNLNVIGGAEPGAGNLISGNGEHGIYVILADDNAIVGNKIGTDATGEAPLGNAVDGICIEKSRYNWVGGFMAGEGNVIGANGLHGVEIFGARATGNIVRGNFIGTDAGTQAIDLGNAEAGIRTQGSDGNTIGGTFGEAGNFIAFSGSDGVRVTGGNLNLIRFNSIWSNAGDGINLGNPAADNNDPLDEDDGANRLQNAPTVLKATRMGGPGSGALVEGVFHGAPNEMLVLDFYSNDPEHVDPTNGEGRWHIGSAVVTTDEFGDATFMTMTSSIEIGQFVTATASTLTHAPLGDTSAFSGAAIVEGPPEISISDAELIEGNSGESQMVFTVTLSHAIMLPTYVDFHTPASPGEDDFIPALFGTVEFEAGETEKTISITIKGDTKFEPDETFTLVLTDPVNGVIADGTGVGTILNDDLPPPPPVVLPRISIGDAMRVEGNSGQSAMTFTVTLSRSSTRSVTVKYRTDHAAGEDDYVGKTGTLTFAPGETSKTITILIKGDTKVEGDETFRVLLSEAVNATILDGTGVGTIKNDDGGVTNPPPPPPPTGRTVSFSPNRESIKEGNTGKRAITFTVRLSAASSQTVKVDYHTVNGSAHSGSDYVSKRGTLTFAPGQTIKTFTIDVCGETKVENDEYFWINLTNVVGATIGNSQAKGTILNDDAACGCGS